MSSSNLFPIKFWKLLTISFGWGCYDPILLMMIQNYYNSSLKVSELKVWVKPPDVFQNVKGLFHVKWSKPGHDISHLINFCQVATIYKIW